MNNPILIYRTVRNSRRIPRLLPASLLALLVASLAAHADIIIDLPDLVLQPNQSDQTFTISVQNTGTSVQLTGVELNLVVGDGSGGAPAFQAVSVVTPATLLFGSNNTGDRGAGSQSGGQIFQRLTSTSSGTVTLGTGTFDLAIVTFDTTGVAPGGYSWSAATSPNGPSFFTDTSPGGVVNPTLIDGTLTVVPEPVNVALSIFGGMAVFAGGLRQWRRQKATAC